MTTQLKNSAPVARTQVEMPRRVLVLGSGALKIGQAGEFDYSGTQALKALKEEGLYTVLVNPSVATVQTSHEFADNVYFLPLTASFIEQVIAAERVDGIMVAFGGQTALNCGLELARSGVLERYGVRLLGTPLAAIEATEDRQLFADTLSEIGVRTARSRAVTTAAEAVDAAAGLGYPVMLRAGIALGGKGSGVARTEQECRDLAERAFAHRAAAAGRGVPGRVEGVRVPGRARCRRSLPDHLQHGERGSRGHPLRRIHRRRPLADAERPAAPGSFATSRSR